MASLSVSGTTLEYIERGRGTPLLLVHGTLEDYRSWTFQLDAFAEHRRVIAYSRRYHFPNPVRGDETDYSPSLHARDLAALVTALDAAPAIIVGSSYGAYLALFLARDFPTLVRALVLAEPPIMPWLTHVPDGTYSAQTFYERVWKPARDAFAQGDVETALRAFVDGVNAPGTFARLNPRTRALLLENAPALRVETQSPHYFEALSDDDVRRIRVPTLLLGGEFSPSHFALILDRLQKNLAVVRRAQIPKAGHAVNLGNPTAYNQTVLAFLDQNEHPLDH